MINKEAYAKYLNTLGGKVDKKIAPKLSINSEEDKASDTEQTNINSSNLLDEEEFLEAQKMKEMIQKKIRDKINKSKVCHNIIEAKQAMVLPLMQEKALKENLDETSKLLNLTFSTFAKGRSLSREFKMPSRATIIGSPPLYEHKKLYSGNPDFHLRALNTPEPQRPAISPLKNLDYALFMETTVSFDKKRFKIPSSHSKKKKNSTGAFKF